MKTTRRVFIGLAAGGAIATAGGLRAQGSGKALRVGIIGVGGYGMVDARAALKCGGVEIASICDVDSAHIDAAVAELEKLQGKKPARYKLYEEMLAAGGMDAVIIATPPHWHALQAIAAVGRGLDVYLEKPIAYDVREGQAIVDAVRRSGRIVQVGFQRRQAEGYRQAAEFIRSGGIGKIVQVDAQIHYKAGTLDPSPKDPPSTLDWDLWCGPGPKIPYSDQVGHKNWRLEHTSGHGHLVDWGIHLIDTVRLMTGASVPKRLVASGGIQRLKGIITTPDTLTAEFEFDEFPLVWRHRLWGATEYDPAVGNGIFFYGESGTVFATDKRWAVVRQKGKDVEREEHEAGGDAGKAHMEDFLTAVRERRQPACPIEEGFKSTATVQLAMIAYETGAPVAWDDVSREIKGNDIGAKLLKREYRKPWVHPFGA